MPLVVRLVWVADGETMAMCARLRIGPAAATFWLAAGPTTPMILAFEANCWATVEASAAESWSSPSTRLKRVWCVVFQFART